MSRVDAANTGFHPTAQGPTGDLTEQWDLDIDDIDTSPAVDDGTVYIGTPFALYAVDAETGEEQWQLEADASSPAVSDGAVFVGSVGRVGGSPFKGVLSLDPESGELVWEFETEGDVDEPVTVAGESVYARDDRRIIYALDRTSGEERWRFESPNDPVAPRPGTAPAVVDDTVYVGDVHTVYGLDRASGEEQWRFETDVDLTVSPAVDSDTVYVGGTGVAFALDATNGAERWRYEATDETVSSQVLMNDHVYYGIERASTGGQPASGVVMACDPATGEQRWQFETEQTIDWGVGVENGLLCGTGRTVHALDPDTGEQRWEAEEILANHSPAVVDGTLYIEDWGLSAYS